MINPSFKNWKTTLAYAAIIWVIAFFYALILFEILGIDYSDTDNKFGLDHEKYWEFEAIMIPSFIIFGFVFLRYLFSKISMNSDNWKEESLGTGFVIMIIQFFLDSIFLVWLFDGGFEYFRGLVVISYILMPFWSYIFAWYLYGRTV